MGNGWHHAYDMGVVADTEEGTLTLRMSDGIPVAFPLPTAEEPSFILSERKEARLEQDGGYCVWDILRTSTTASRARSTIPCACLRA
ncbi:hypothetical protein NXV81_28235 [Bacteroides ovatus]|nr:hypothetical protein [Bacteroides ovatus]